MKNSNECKPMLVIYTTDDVCKMFHLGKVKCLELFRRDDFPAQMQKIVISFISIANTELKF